MKIDKSKLRMGLWYEDADGNRIPWDDNRVDAPENAEIPCRLEEIDGKKCAVFDLPHTEMAVVALSARS